MTRLPYPLFIPPAPLAVKVAAERTLKEARQFKDWLLETMPDRIAALLNYFGVDRWSLPPRDALLLLGDKVAEALFEDEFSQPGEEQRVLTNAGYALAADMGLLLAQLVLDEYGHRLRWEILRKPRRHAFFNRPVVAPFPVDSWDPIGGSIAVAFAILSGDRAGDEWARTLDQIREELGPP